MSGPAGDPAPAPAPTTDALAALPADAWAWLLPHVRAALHALDDADRSPATERLRAAPTSRLAGGRTRRELDALLARGGPVWREVVARAGAAPDPPVAVGALLRGEARPPTSTRDTAPPSPPSPPGDDVARLRARLRAVRGERDDARRQLEGANARAAAAEAARAELERALATARDEATETQRRLDAATADRERAVERERRRRDAEVRRLTDTVSELRRADAERRDAQRRRAEADAQAAARARSDADREVAQHLADGPSSRLVPGRPSRLPADVAPGTTEAAGLLLHPGRQVVVDGYNVTKQHQGDLDLEAQRAWLVRTCAALAARRRVRPHVVFDGQAAGSTRPPAGAREVVVTFTPAGITADDEVVLIVEATDGPVTVVTDDRDLADRVRVSGADVVGTVPFLGVTRRA